MKWRRFSTAPDSANGLSSQHAHPRYDQRRLSFITCSLSVLLRTFYSACLVHRRLILSYLKQGIYRSTRRPAISVRRLTCDVFVPPFGSRLKLGTGYQLSNKL